MDGVKRGTTPYLGVKFNVRNNEISTIDFLLKQENSEDAEPLVLKSYPDDVDYDAETDRYLVPMTEAETRLFLPNHAFYMDSRITLTNGLIPQTEIMKIRMGATLFGEEDEPDPGEDIHYDLVLSTNMRESGIDLIAGEFDAIDEKLSAGEPILGIFCDYDTTNEVNITLQIQYIMKSENDIVIWVPMIHLSDAPYEIGPDLVPIVWQQSDGKFVWG